MRIDALLVAFALVATCAAGTTQLAQAQQNGDCRLDAFRTRIDRVEKSLVVRDPTEAATNNARGTAFRTFDYGLTGTLEGCVAVAGPIPSLKAGYSYFYDVPDMSFPQERLLTDSPLQPFALPIGPESGNTTQRFFARGTFKASDGAGLNLFVPARPSDWNGKLFIAQRGSGIYDPLDTFALRTATDPFPSSSGANVYLENMIDRGYAVAFLRKDAVRPPLGKMSVTLNDGRVMSASNTAHVVLALAMIEFAQQEVTRRLGRAPAKTFYYGHSGGGISGRLINYSGANVARDGKPIVDGLILDDAGNGVYLPVAFHDGVDIALSSDADRRHFVPQIDLARQLYNPISYLPAKRLNDSTLTTKGFANRHRLYEIRGTSHFDAGMVRMVAKDQNPVNFLDLSGLISALMDDLDAWVTRGAAPPPAQAVAMPEVTCPLGTYVALPIANGAMTHLIAFDGVATQPTIGVAETMTSAWQRLGIAGSAKSVTQDQYLSCIAGAVEHLTAERLLPAGAVAWYRARALSLLDASGARF